MKEQYASRLINELGVTVFDNMTPSATADPNEYGSLTGRDITGAFNGSMTLNDIFDMWAYMAMRGFTPDTLILHPLAWKVFAIDPEIREIVLKGNTLATRRMPQGSYSPAWGTGHEGRGLRTTATGTGYAAGYGTGPGAATGKIGADPWVNTLNPLGSTYNIAPSYLPSPLTVIVSPFVHYQQGGASISTGTPAVTRSYPTTSVIMCQSDACGILVQRTPVGVEEWDNPERDIRNMKIRESWGMQLLEQGKGVTVARYVVIARNYVFDNTNAVTLGEHNITTAISTITG